MDWCANLQPATIATSDWTAYPADMSMDPWPDIQGVCVDQVRDLKAQRVRLPAQHVNLMFAGLWYFQT